MVLIIILGRGVIMRNIIELFTDPEVCAEEMIEGNSTKTIGKGIMIIAQESLLIGLVGAIGLRSILLDLIAQVPQIGFLLLDNLNRLSNRRFEVLSIILVLVAAVVVFVGSILKAFIMAVTLFIIKFLVRGEATFKQLLRITVFSQVISVSLIFVGAICVAISMPATTYIVEEVSGAVMFLQYWYLVFTVVGFNAANRVGIIRSIIAVLLMQSAFWGLQYLVLPGYMLF